MVSDISTYKAPDKPSNPYDGLTKAIPGEPNDCGVATVTYYVGAGAADALARQVIQPSATRSTLTQGWNGLSSDEKCSFIANGLGVASGAAGIAGLALGGGSSGNITLKVSIKNESNAVVVPYSIGPSESQPNASWAFVKEAPTVILPGEETNIEMEKTTSYPTHHSKLHFQVKSLDQNIGKTVGIDFYIQHWVDGSSIFWFVGIGIVNPDNGNYVVLRAPDREDYSEYRLHYWEVIGISGYGGFPSIGISSLDTRGRTEQNETATLQISFVAISN